MKELDKIIQEYRDKYAEAMGEIHRYNNMSPVEQAAFDPSKLWENLKVAGTKTVAALEIKDRLKL